MSLQTLSDSLDIISGLVIPSLKDDIDVIQKLDDEPNDVGGLTASELKAKFDEAGNIIKKYLNETLVPQLSDTVAEAEVRAAAERERVDNENIRIENEDARQENETSRVQAENARADAESARKTAEAQREANEQSRKNSFDEEIKQAKSWAVGGTGVRDGEDTNNAKYWSEQAKANVGGDFATNSRVDEVEDEVGRVAQSVTTLETKVEQDVGQAVQEVNQTISGLQTRVQPINLGGTGATTAEQALANLGGIAAGAVGNLHVWERVQDGVTDYLTSTDRNAYPDNATDAQDAYYTLGDVVMGSFQMAEGYPSNNVFYETANSINVGADGAIILNSPTVASFTSDSFPDDASFLGKFIRFSHRGASGSTTPPATTPPFNTTPSEVVYIPASATITHTNGIHAVDRYQPVTGHAAIPANTTITYLGQLGGGARIEVGSYVGTGTYGSSNPNTLTFGFEPKIVIIYCVDSFDMAIFSKNSKKYSVTSSGDTTGGGICEFKNSGKTLEYYYPHSSPDSQLNYGGFEYHYIAIG